MTKLEWFFEFAKTAAIKSKDKATKVGCVIVGPDDDIRSVGYNGFVRKANDNLPEWHERPLKYDVTAHAEENAVANAARIGISLKGCDTYITLPPCTCCTRMLVQSGIKSINFLMPFDKASWKERWGENFKIALTIIRSGGVAYCAYSGEFFESCKSNMFSIDKKEFEVASWLREFESIQNHQMKLR